jgi:hypothetical protein
MITPKEDEFDCFWIDPTDRNVLLNMPSDVSRWLPLVFREPFQQFLCLRTVDEGGGDWFNTAILLPGQRSEPVEIFARNL